MQKKWLAAACATAFTWSLIPAQASAQEPGETIDRWTGDVELAYLVKRGNTRSDTINARSQAERDFADWRHQVRLDAANAEQRNNTTGDMERSAERYFGSYKIDLKLDGANYLFNLLEAEKDRFTGYDYEASYALGIGRRMFDNSLHRLDLEAGPGYRQRRLEEQPAEGRRTEEDALLRLGLRYLLNLSENAQFRQETSTEIEDDATLTRAATSVTSKLNSRLSLRVTHTLRHNSDPAPTARSKTDQEVTVGLVYGF